jgi:hypothetical protein
MSGLKEFVLLVMTAKESPEIANFFLSWQIIRTSNLVQ